MLLINRANTRTMGVIELDPFTSKNRLEYHIGMTGGGGGAEGSVTQVVSQSGGIKAPISSR